MEFVLPPAILQMRHLKTLNLRSTSMKLTEDIRGQLCELTQLQSLDLSNNPLGLSPTLARMNELREVNLRHTGISICPAGILDEPYLTLLDLRDNQITRVPPAIVRQAIAPGRVLLHNNPLTDVDTLQRLIRHRQQTGINLWLRQAPQENGEAGFWLRDMSPAQQQARTAIWQRLAARTLGPRFLRVIEGLGLTPESLLGYSPLQARVWRMLSEADASDELFVRLAQDIETTDADADNPMAGFTTLEGRARHYRDWVAMGRPFNH
jgi:Leucine-rich repeat (LRR) protein